MESTMMTTSLCSMLLLVVCLSNVACFTTSEANMKEWNEYKIEFNKIYRDADEEDRRMQIFLESKEFVAKHNAKYATGEVSYKMGINQFSDLTFDEFNPMMNGLKMPRELPVDSQSVMSDFGKLPKEVDWRKKGVVTPVKDQRYCGSCWAFSATGALEGQHALKTGKLVSLSEQNLVDCNKESCGCCGGFQSWAFDYVKKYGIDTETAYPYEGRNDFCHFNKSTVGATIKGYIVKKPYLGDEIVLKKIVAKIGPISVLIEATDNFKHYREGVFYDKDCMPGYLNHAVLVVGYGTEDGKDYWIVKNSWGRTFGEDGYIKMARNKKNNCGIATVAIYPVV